jgi:hypothetical protein
MSFAFDVPWSPWAVYPLTYFYSLVVGNYLVRWGLEFFLRTNVPKPVGNVHPRAWAVGVVERTIYTSCVVLGLPIEIIGGWVALKGLAQFRPHGNEHPDTDKFLDDYYGYLIGTGLSLIVGVGLGLLGRHLLGLPLMPEKSESKKT